MKCRSTKRAMSMALAAALAFTPMTAMAATDTKGHWAEKTITAWEDAGLLKGYSDGSVKPDNKITRAEFVTMMNKALKNKAVGAIAFTDVKEGDWFYGAVAAAVGAGYTKGYPDGSFKPNATITRAEAAVMIANAAGLKADEAAANKFTDAAAIPTWAKGSVGAAVAAGYMSGYPDGSFGGGKTITRAESISTLNRAMNGGEVKVEDVVVTKDDTVIENQTIEGNLIIDKAVGDGEVYVKNTEVKGNLIVQGGGDDSIYLTDVTVNDKIILDKAGVRLQVSGKTKAATIEVKQYANIAEKDFEGKIGTITITNDVKDAKAVIVNAPTNKVVVDGKADVVVKADVTTVEMTKKAEDATMEVAKGAAVGAVVADSKIKLSGEGKVEKLEANASGITVDKNLKVEKTETAKDVKGPVVGNVSKPSTSGGGGGSSKSSSKKKVSATISDASLTVDKDATALPKEVTVNLTGAKLKKAKSYTAAEAGATLAGKKDGSILKLTVDSLNVNKTYTFKIPAADMTALSGYKEPQDLTVTFKLVVLDKTELKAAIAAAEENLAKIGPNKNVVISVDGKDVAKDMQWVTQEVYDNLDKALKAAKANFKTQAEADAAKDALKAANDKFVPKNGTNELELAALNAEILKAQELLDKVANKEVVVAENGNDLYADQKWVVQEKVDKLKTKLGAAKAKFTEQGQVNAAKEALTQALTEAEPQVGIKVRPAVTAADTKIDTDQTEKTFEVGKASAAAPIKVVGTNFEFADAKKTTVQVGWAAQVDGASDAATITEAAQEVATATSETEASAEITKEVLNGLAAGTYDVYVKVNDAATPAWEKTNVKIKVTAPKKEITDFVKVDDVTITEDKHLYTAADVAQRELPRKVTLKAGDENVEVDVTWACETYDPQYINYPHVFKATYTLPDGYVDNTNKKDVTVNVILTIEQQMGAVEKQEVAAQAEKSDFTFTAGKKIENDNVAVITVTGAREVSTAGVTVTPAGATKGITATVATADVAGKLKVTFTGDAPEKTEWPQDFTVTIPSTAITPDENHKAKELKVKLTVAVNEAIPNAPSVTDGSIAPAKVTKGAEQEVEVTINGTNLTGGIKVGLAQGESANNAQIKGSVAVQPGAGNTTATATIGQDIVKALDQGAYNVFYSVDDNTWEKVEGATLTVEEAPATTVDVQVASIKTDANTLEVKLKDSKKFADNGVDRSKFTVTAESQNITVQKVKVNDGKDTAYLTISGMNGEVTNATLKISKDALADKDATTFNNVEVKAGKAVTAETSAAVDAKFNEAIIGKKVTITLTGATVANKADVVIAPAQVDGVTATVADISAASPTVDINIGGTADKVGNKEFKATIAADKLTAAEGYIVTGGVEATATVNVAKGDVDAIKVNGLTKPAASTAPVKTVTAGEADKYTVAVKWQVKNGDAFEDMQTDAQFEASKEYQAVITVTPTENYAIKADGFDENKVTVNSDDTTATDGTKKLVGAATADKVELTVTFVALS